jgi:glycosyltransferase involved in cell wall biosynthesis
VTAGERQPRSSVILLGAPLPPPYGGIARYLQHAVPALLADGYAVMLVQPPNSNGNPEPVVVGRAAPTASVFELQSPASAARYLLRRPFTGLRLLSWYLPALLRLPRRGLSEMLVTVSWMISGERVAQGQSIGIIHAYDYPWSQGAAAVLLARRLGAKSVVSIFGEVVPHEGELELFDAFSRWFKRASRKTIQSADQAASMTQHCRDGVRYFGIDPRDLALVRLVVGMERFRPDAEHAGIRSRYAISGRPLLLFVGQVRPRKGPQVLVSALPTILQKHPSARLLIVGPDHGYSDELLRLAARLGVGHAIELVGAVSDELLPAFYAASTVFLFPSVTPIECLGLTFVQAMFAGKPVIATDSAGAPEVIRDGLDGYLVEPSDTLDTAEKVLRVLDLPDPARVAMGERARERVQTLFPEGEVLRDLQSLYERLLRE